MLKNKFGMATRVLLIVLSVLMAVSLAACKKGDTIDPDQMNSAIQSAIDAANKAQAEKDAALASSIAADKAAQEAKDAANAASIAADKLANDEALKKAEEAAAAAKKAADEAAKKAAEQEAALKKAQDEAAAAKKAADEAAKKAADEAAKAAEKAAAEAAAKAAEEAAAAAKVQEELLKKAQEEAAAAKAAADAAAAQAAADKAALQAALEKALAEAEAAAKAASEAIAKAEAAASKADETTAVPETTVAPETTVVPETTKDPAIAALEEALKQALAEAEAAKKAASEALAKAEAAASKADETTVVPETTTKAPETTTQAPETTTKAPETTQAPVMEDKSDVLTAFSKLKTEYTYTKASMYNAAEYEELQMLFDKASNDLYNAMTVEAATSIYNTLIVDVSAVRSLENAAAELIALIDDLGDVETEVFTTQADKVEAVRESYTALKAEYPTYFELNLDVEEGEDPDTANTDLKATKLGINVADLEKAEAKLETLKGYILATLKADMADIYSLDKKQRYDAEVVDTADTDYDIKMMMEDVYYKYRVLSVINKGDVAAADTAVEWDEDNEPTKWFTAEDLYNVYILPTLDVELADYANAILKQFETAVSATGLFADMGTNTVIATLESGRDTSFNLNRVTPKYTDIDSELGDVYDALEADLFGLSFADDFKSTNTIAEAKVDVATRAIKAYIDALNVYLTEAKKVAIEYEELAAQKLIDAANTAIDGYENLLATEENTAKIAQLNNNIAKSKAAIATHEANLAAFKANVEAATMLTYDEMLNADLKKLTVYTNAWRDLSDLTADGFDATADVLETTGKIDEYAAYMQTALANTIDVNFASTLKDNAVVPADKVFATLRDYMAKDLENFAKRLSTAIDGNADKTGYGDIYDDLKGEWPAYVTPAENSFPNKDAFDDILAALADDIAAIRAMEVTDYSAETKQLKKDSTYYYYFKDANAKAYASSDDTYSYDPTDYDSLVAVINAAEGLVKTDKTANKANPVQVTYTADDVAVRELVKAYVAAYTAAHAGVHIEDDEDTTDIDESAGNYNGLVELGALTTITSNAKKLITNGDKTAFDKLSATTGGALQTEIKAFGTYYTKAIDTARTTLKNNLAIEQKTFIQESVILNDYLKNGAFVTIMTPSTFEANDYAGAYDYDGFADVVDAKVKEFYKNFYGLDAVDTATTATSVVEQLWAYKLEVAAKIDSTIATYKNTKTIKADGLCDITAATALGGQYAYGVTGTDIVVAGIPEVVATYEAKLDDLANAAKTAVMGVTFQDKKITVKDTFDAKIITDVNAKYNSLANAKKIVDAYYTQLFGTETVVVHPNNQAADVTFNAGNSQIFQEYNSIVLGNTYGYAKVN